MQFVVVACALLGVALGQYAGYGAYPGYAGYAGYPGYAGLGGYPGYAGYAGYKGYPGYAGWAGYKGYPGYPGFLPAAVKPADPKVKEVVKAVAPAVPVAQVLPAPLPALPIAPVPAKAWSGPYPAIRSQTNAASPDGAYSYSYETETGIAAAESGAPRIGPNGPEEVVVGEYAYTSPEGVPVHVRYTADGEGFHPEIISPSYDGYLAARSAVPVVAPIVPVVPVSAETAEEAKEESDVEKKEE